MQAQPFFHRFTPKSPDGETVWVFGVVMSIRDSKKTLFFDLRHALGKIQVVADKALFSEQTNQLREIRANDRVRVQGTVGATKSGTKSIFLSEIPTKASSFLAGTLAEMEPSSDYSKIGTSIIVAHARTRAERFFDQEDYRRIEPRYLSSTWHLDEGITPLRVNYPGFGLPVYLAPSPSHQLLGTCCNGR